MKHGGRPVETPTRGHQEIVVIDAWPRGQEVRLAGDDGYTRRRAYGESPRRSFARCAHTDTSSRTAGAVGGATDPTGSLPLISRAFQGRWRFRLRAQSRRLLTAPRVRARAAKGVSDGRDTRRAIGGTDECARRRSLADDREPPPARPATPGPVQHCPVTPSRSLGGARRPRSKATSHP